MILFLNFELLIRVVKFVLKVLKYFLMKEKGRCNEVIEFKLFFFLNLCFMFLKFLNSLRKLLGYL